MSKVEILSKVTVTSMGGKLRRVKHMSSSTNTNMIFAIFLPSTYAYDGDKTISQPIPAIYWLSGLTCTDENFCQKAGGVAFAAADEAGVALIMPDTSPRADGASGEVADNESYDLGMGAGFYINATRDPWRLHYRMEDYVRDELPALVETAFPGVGADNLKSIMGHSMGGHGALTIAFKDVVEKERQRPSSWTSVSAFAPICHPTMCPWGRKAFENYFGSVADGEPHDATRLLERNGDVIKDAYDDILIDEGTDDNFGKAGQLLLRDFEAAADRVGQKLTVRRQPEHDHSYYFIASFVADHVAFHVDKLRRRAAGQ